MIILSSTAFDSIINVIVAALQNIMTFDAVSARRLWDDDNTGQDVYSAESGESCCYDIPRAVYRVVLCAVRDALEWRDIQNIYQRNFNVTRCP